MTRISLPNRRRNETIAFDHRGQRYLATAGYYPGGEIGELFLAGGRSGTDIEAMARDAAVVTSLAFQHGVSLDVVRRAVTRLDDGTAAGPLGAVLDMIGERS